MIENRQAMSHRNLSHQLEHQNFDNINESNKTNNDDDKQVIPNSSQALFLVFIVRIGIIYVILALASIPILIKLSESAQMFYEIEQQYSEKSVGDNNFEQLKQILLIGTLKNTVQIIQQSEALNIGQQKNQEEDNKEWQEYSSLAVHILSFNWLLDIILQCLLIVFGCFLEYLVFRARQKQKGKHIEDYSLEIRNVPLLPSYILEPKIKQYLRNQLEKQMGVKHEKSAIFDVDSSYAQQRYYGQRQLDYLQQLKHKFTRFEENGHQNTYSCFRVNKNKELLDLKQKILKQQKFIKTIQIRNTKQNVVWVTFQNRKSKYLAYRKLQSGLQFLNNKLGVRKAPHPTQIIWTNLYQSRVSIILSKLLAISIFVIVIFLFDLVILYISQFQYKILASLGIIILEIVLKEIVLRVNKIEKHSRQSSLELSIFTKLTKYLYINTGLLIFISSFDFGDNFLSNFFSSREHAKLSKQWFETVGLNIMLTSIVQVLYVNLRLPGEYLKKKMTNYLKKNTDKSSKNKLESDLEICYGHFLSVLMVFNTYTYTHPIFYIFSAVLCFSTYFSHKWYLYNSTESPTYNSNIMSYKAINFIFLSIIAHFFCIFLLTKSISSIIIGGSLIIFLVVKNTIYFKIVEKCRKNYGPLCFITYRGNQINENILNILTKSQIEQKIKWLKLKFAIMEAEYYKEYKYNGFIQRSYFQKQCRNLIARIQQLINIQQQKQNWNIGNTPVISGQINYKLLHSKNQNLSQLKP